MVTGKFQVTFGHVSVENKSLGETVTDFALAGYLELPTVVSVNTKHAFVSDDNKICLSIKKVLLSAAAVNIAFIKEDLRLGYPECRPPPDITC